jgi:phospholipid/cholesterol/gamma-HCH transport system permease protein
VVAAVLCIIPLYLFSLYASFLATELVTTKFFGLSPGVYDHYFRLYLPPIDVAYSTAKAVVFAAVVSLIHCYYGYYASGGPAGVGVAVGRAIRLSIVTVVVLNLIMSLLFWGGGNTVKIAG